MKYTLDDNVEKRLVSGVIIATLFVIGKLWLYLKEIKPLVAPLTNMD